jgi:hypothetical protein
VGISATSKWQLGWVPVAFGLAGACAMFVAAGLLIRESRLAVRGAEFEIDYVRKLVARKTATPDADEKPEGGQGEG